LIGISSFVSRHFVEDNHNYFRLQFSIVITPY
jgi:hypothetical protein